MKKEIVYLYEPVLSSTGSNDPRFDNLILHSRVYNYFTMLLNTIFDKVFRKTTKPYYLGSYITYMVAKNDELVLFREMVLTRGCAFSCYLFVLCLASVESSCNLYDKLETNIKQLLCMPLDGIKCEVSELYVLSENNIRKAKQLLIM